MSWLLPNTGDALARGRAGVVVAACLGVIGAVIALILAWLISGDLEGETVVAGAVFSLMLGGVAALARAGRATLAVWLLTGLLWLAVTATVAPYGAGTFSLAGYVLPVVLVASLLGLWAGLAVAGASALVVWGVAWAAAAGRFEPLIPYEESHLTFNAPAATVILLLTALIVGAWSSYVSRLLCRRN